MDTSNYLYHHGEQELYGYLAYDEKITAPAPAILIAHDWTGRNDFACEKAEMMATMGYVGFAIDMYGLGRNGETRDEKRALMEPLVGDRLLLRARIQAAFDTVAEMPEVDQNRIAAMGFCFGGLCVLDLARTGADLKGVISFHGLLSKPHNLANADIKAKILALHGYNDPMVTPPEVNQFCLEMEEAKADWQVHAFGQTKHAFTTPDANDEHFGTVYNNLSNRRAMQAMVNFFEEIFQS